MTCWTGEDRPPWVLEAVSELPPILENREVKSMRPHQSGTRGTLEAKQTSEPISPQCALGTALV